MNLLVRIAEFLLHFVRAEVSTQFFHEKVSSVLLEKLAQAELGLFFLTNVLGTIAIVEINQLRCLEKAASTLTLVALLAILLLVSVILMKICVILLLVQI